MRGLRLCFAPRAIQLLVRYVKSEVEAPKGAFSCEPERANVHVSDSERSREGAQAPSVRVSVSERSREPQAN